MKGIGLAPLSVRKLWEHPTSPIAHFTTPTGGQTLRGINSETIDLIAIDPPFNKGKDFHATPDSLASGAKFQDRWSWANDVEGEWVDQITDGWPKVMTIINAARESYGADMGAFLCFLGVRLLAMHRILKTTGSIYLH